MSFRDRLRRAVGRDRAAGAKQPSAVLPIDVVECVDGLVRLGFDTRAEVLQAALDRAAEEDPAPSPNAVAEIVDRMWRARLREQATWPAVTDADRVAAAFDDLERAGVLARMCFLCCTSCAVDAIDGEVPAGEKRRGFVYFHQQDAARLLEPDPVLYLGYGAFDAPDRATHEAQTLAVAHMVREALERHGLRVEWDGTTEERLRVPGLVWRRRLPAEVSA